jgi:hypothetical protein
MAKMICYSRLKWWFYSNCGFTAGINGSSSYSKLNTIRL